MEHWHRLSDDEVLKLESLSWQFECPNGSYTLILDTSDQNSIAVNFRGLIEYWPVEMKERRNSDFKLSGFAWETSALGLETHSWFELFIPSNPRITFWGDKVIYRTDLCDDA